jgi:hypothetical protein
MMSGPQSDVNPLEQWFLEEDHRLTSKWSHYFDIYHRHFSRFRGRPVTLLEIGVQGGGSMEMWAHYFGPQARIIGADLSEDVRQFAAPGAELYIGDQADPDFLRDMLAKIGTPIDIFIDDGGHTMEQQRVTFEICFPALAENAVYLCEDVHTSYWPPYGGGLLEPGSFIELMKTKIDELNGWNQWGDGVTDFTGSADSIHFYDSVVVIERTKRKRPVSMDRGRGAAST